MRATRPQTANGAALGFRVKSGWATAVLLAEPIHAPRVLKSDRVELSDPAVPESRQPYHADTGTFETDEAKVLRRIEIVRRCTHDSITKLLQNYRSGGYIVCCVALAVGSTIAPATIPNPHIRAHALEGELFRTILKEETRALGLRCLVMIERNAYAEAAATLAVSEGELKRTLSVLGRERGGPWRADQKLAALVAWTALKAQSVDDARVGE